MRTEYLVSWDPPDDLLAMLQLSDPELRPWSHQYETEQIAREHMSRALITLSLLFHKAGLDLAWVKVELTMVQYGA